MEPKRTKTERDAKAPARLTMAGVFFGGGPALRGGGWARGRGPGGLRLGRDIK